MTIKVSLATLGILMVGALTACSSSSSSPEDSGTPGDGSTASETSTNEEAAAPDSSTSEEASTMEASTPEDTGTAETSTAPPDSGSGDGGTCAYAIDTGDMTCNTCIANSSALCTALTTCGTPDDAGVDDAGSSACLQLVGCINDIDSVDAGADGGAGAADCNSTYTSTEQTNAQAVFTAIHTDCSSQCPGL